MPSVPNERAVTAEDLVTVPQLAELPLEAPQLTWPDGTPLRLRVRALTFGERRAANRAAAKAGSAGGVDGDVWAIEVLFRGLVAPRLTEAQKHILWDLNAEVVDAAVNTIVGLGRLSPRAVDARLSDLAGVAIPPGTAPDADPPGGE